MGVPASGHGQRSSPGRRGQQSSAGRHTDGPPKGSGTEVAFGAIPMRLRYDGGTIVLEEVAHEVDVATLPGVLWDARIERHRAPARCYPNLRRELAARGVDLSDEVASAARREAPQPWREVELRPYQEAALAAWQQAGRRGLIALPTGSGKTRVALAAMARAGLTALCLVPTRVLLDQWCAELARFYSGAIGRWGDGHHEVAAVTVATYESAWRHMGRLGDRFALLIVDEAHHFGCGVRDEALEMCIAEARLGLSATLPSRGEAALRLAELLGPPVFSLAIGDLAGTFLAPFDLLTLALDLTGSERQAYDAWMAAFRPVAAELRRLHPGATWEELCRAAVRTAQGRRALHALRLARRLVAFSAAKRAALRALLERHRDARVLVFTADNEAAYAVARESLVMPITCDIARKEREEALSAFRDGRLRALVSARVLNEGLDVPDADVAIVVGSALGTREFVQRVGRLLRPVQGKRALVYELVVRGTLDVRQSRRRRAGLGARASDPA